MCALVGGAGGDGGGGREVRLEGRQAGMEGQAAEVVRLGCEAGR